MTHNGIIIE